MIVIPELGILCLIISFALACYLGSSLWMATPNRVNVLLWGKASFLLLGFITLILCFLQNNFSVSYVALNSNTHLPFIYKLCATWGAHEGSLLLWIVMLVGWTLLLAPLKQERPIAVLSLLSAAFLLILLQTSNPFARVLPDYPKEGIDLNPLLQDPGFIIHPPFLYMGYVGFAIPFAFSIAALYQRDHALHWIKLARPFALMAWGFLTVGIILGSWWAYYELGWGGWWFWDPVENASLMPWLMGGALCHAMMLASKQNQYIGWCHLLAMTTFVLSLMGTFLVRSGMISSVHAFASDPQRGIYILLFLFSVMTISFLLYVFRSQSTPSNQNITLFSKGSGILLGNVILIVMTFTVLLGTLYPLAMEVLFQKRMSIGAPYFKTIFAPLVGILFILMSIVPYIQWDQDRAKALLARIRWPLVIFILAAVIYVVLAPKNVIPYAGIFLAAWLILATLYKGVISKKEIHWGMTFSHIGLAVSMMGMILVNNLETEKEFPLGIGESIEIAGTTFKFEKVEVVKGSNYEGRQGTISLIRKGTTIATAYPERRYFPARDLVMTETDIIPGLIKDYYLALGERLDDGRWSVRIYIKPFVRWIWLGGLFIALGAFYSGYRSWQQIRKHYVNK